MKRKLTIGLFCILLLPLLAGCCLSHDWQPATCQAPETCAKCGKTQGEVLPHNWQEATCEVSRTCTGCGITEGDPLGHDWQEATCEAPESCTRCAKTQGKALGHDMDGVIQGDTFVETCANCGAELSETIVWESFAPPLLEGEWNGIRMIYKGDEYGATGDMYAQFNEDGTYCWNFLGRDLVGTWEFRTHSEEQNGAMLFQIYLDGEGAAVAIIFDNDLSVLSITTQLNRIPIHFQYERA